MTGPYYCNGEIPNCQYKDHCYKNGGTCYHTIDERYAGKKPPNIEELRRRRRGGTKEPSQKECRITIECPHQQQSMTTTVIVSVISAFVTALIVILARMW